MERKRERELGRGSDGEKEKERVRENDGDKERIKFVTQRIRGRTERFEKKVITVVKKDI